MPVPRFRLPSSPDELSASTSVDADSQAPTEDAQTELHHSDVLSQLLDDEDTETTEPAVPVDEDEDESTDASADAPSRPTQDDLPERPEMTARAREQRKRDREYKTSQRRKRQTPKAKKAKAEKMRKRYTTTDATTVNVEVERPAPVVEVYGGRKVRATQGSLLKDSLTAREKWNNLSTTNRKYHFERDDEKIKERERQFFESVGTNLRAHNQGKDDMSFLNPPKLMNETDEQRNARVRRITEAVYDLSAFKRKSRKSFGYKHREMLDFLARFRFAKASHLSHLFGEAVNTTYGRLLEMRAHGLVIDKPIYGTDPLWFLTKAGMMVAGYEYSNVTNASISMMMLPHTFLVTHLATYIRSGILNVLDEDEFPVRNRTSTTGEPMYGDTVVSEYSIQSAFSKIRLERTSDVYVPIIRQMMEREFSEWEDAGGVSFGPSPEMMFGNEYMFVTYPPRVIGISYHVPDLVVARPRNPDGTPNSIAIEAERSTSKTIESYRRSIQAYKMDTSIYSQVIWVVHKKTTATRLLRAEEGLGMIDSGRMKIIPIITENGIYKEPELWLL